MPHRNLREKRKDFIQGLQKLSPRSKGKSLTELFSDFCALTVAGIAGQSAFQPDQRQRHRETYNMILADYPDPQKFELHMARLVQECTGVVAKGRCDFLGDIAAEIGSLDQTMGQYYTPYNVCILNAGLQFSGFEQIISKRSFITVSDPATGSAAMLLALADMLEDHGYCPSRNMWAEATDLSPIASKMAFMSLSWRGVAGIVIHGNSLTLEQFDRLITPAGRSFLTRHSTPF